MKNNNQNLKKYKQEHLLRFKDEISAEQFSALNAQIAYTDFSYLDNINKTVKTQDVDYSPIKAITIQEIQKDYVKYETVGINAIKQKKIGVLILAGGMGTRLGSDEPKGMFDIGLTRKVYIFQKLIENLMEVVKKANCFIPLFIMTSDKNDGITQKFFADNNYFGYNKDYICFFIQDQAPCCGFDGKILLENKFTLATSPNGNGGWYNSLLANKKAKEMLEKYKVEWLNVVAVDNVLQKMADPVFVGATLMGDYQVGSKVIKKANPEEKVGVMCNKNSHPSVVEYIDLSKEMATAVDEKGERLYNYGVILNYLFNVELLNSIKDVSLPVHVVKKKISHIDNKGNIVEPTEPNGYKFEMLCVDMIELADSCLPFEVERSKEFAPIKNKTGVDSVDSARELLVSNGYIL